jgi:hypothetical protein
MTFDAMITKFQNQARAWERSDFKRRFAPLLREIVIATQGNNARANALARQALRELGVEDA